MSDERLRWPGRLTYSERFTHISGYPSAAGRAPDRESSPAKDQRSTTVPRNQLVLDRVKNGKKDEKFVHFTRQSGDIFQV